MKSVIPKHREKYINTNIKVCVLKCILSKRGNSVNLNTYLQNVQQGVFALRESYDIPNKQELFDKGIIPNLDIYPLDMVKRHAYCISKTTSNYRAHILITKTGVSLPRWIPRTWNGLLVSDLDFKYSEKHLKIKPEDMINYINTYIGEKIQQSEDNIFKNNLICTGISLSKKGMHIYWGVEDVVQITDNKLRNIIYKSKASEIFFEINKMLDYILKKDFHCSKKERYTCKLAINDPSAILHTQLLMRERPGSLYFNTGYKGTYACEDITEEDMKTINSSFMYIYNLRGKHNNVDKENPLTLLDSDTGIITPISKKETKDVHDFIFDSSKPYYNTEVQIKENALARNRIDKYKLYIDPQNLKKLLETPNRKIPHLFYDDRWRVLNIFRLCCNIEHPVKLYHTLFSDGTVFSKGDELTLMNNVPIRCPNFFTDSKYIDYINNILGSKIIGIDFKSIIIPGCISVIESKYNTELSYFKRDIIRGEIRFWLSEYRKRYITKSKPNDLPLIFTLKKNNSPWIKQSDVVTRYKTKYTARCYNPHFCENLFNALKTDSALYPLLKELDGMLILNACSKYLSSKDLPNENTDLHKMKDIDNFLKREDYINKSKSIITGLLYKTYDFITTTTTSIKCNIHDIYIALTKLKIKNKEIYDNISNSLNSELDILRRSKKLGILQQLISSRSCTSS
jgi:hypothetical protein